MANCITQAVDIDNKNTTPQAIAESIRPLLQSTKCFTCNIAGTYGSGKTTVLARLVGIAEQIGIGWNQIAIFAASHDAIRRLRTLAGNGRQDLDPQTELFAEGLSGVPMDAFLAHTAMLCDDIPRFKWLMRDYLARLARMNRLDDSDRDKAFIETLKPRLCAGLRAELESRLEGKPLPRNAYLQAIADYVVEYKRDRRLADRADLVHSDYYAARHVRLVLLDEVDGEDQRLLRRYFPNASVVTTSLDPQPADVRLELPRCLRAPECIEIADPDPQPGLVPPPTSFASLFILTAPWRRGRWAHWLAQYGLPLPSNWSRWRAMVAAWRLDQDRDVRSRDLNPLLARAGLRREENEWLIYRDGVAGWTNWRDVGACDALVRDHAAAVLARYGSLEDGLPTVRIGLPASVRNLEADAAIVDGNRWPDETSADIALSRATRWLAVLEQA